jgi:hypothetical protein
MEDSVKSILNVHQTYVMRLKDVKEKLDHIHVEIIQNVMLGLLASLILPFPLLLFVRS